MASPKHQHLTYFVSLAETASFSRAAKLCGVSQPSLSHGIRDLEQILDCRLFERDTRSVHITEAGQRVLPLARACLARWNHALSDIANVARGKSRVVTIHAVTTFTGGILPRVITHCDQVFPDVEFRVSDAVSPEVENAVHSGKADFGLCLAPIEPEKFDQVTVIKDEIYVCCHRSHPLARAKTLTWEEVLDHDIIALAEPSAIYGDIERVFAQNARKFRPSASFRYQSSLMGMLATGSFYTILPLLMLRGTDFSQLAIIPLVKPIVNRSYLLIRPKMNTRTPGESDLFDFLSQEVSRLGIEEKQQLQQTVGVVAELAPEA